jgi:hypothetical protein
VDKATKLALLLLTSEAVYMVSKNNIYHKTKIPSNNARSNIDGDNEMESET